MAVCAKCRNAFANRRQFAYLVDGVLYFAAAHYLLLALAYFVLAPAGLTRAASPAPTVGLSLLAVFGLDDVHSFIGSWILPLVFYCRDGFSGACLGKRLCGVQVIDAATREPIGFGQSLKRNLVILIPLVGFIGCIVTMMDGQRWGDRWAGTMVVWKKYQHRAPFDQRGLHCQKCGYDLTGNTTGRCPECGTPTGRAAIAIPVGPGSE